MKYRRVNKKFVTSVEIHSKTDRVTYHATILRVKKLFGNFMVVQKNVGSAIVREKSAIICCHLSYLLMDDGEKKNNQKLPIRTGRKIRSLLS